MRPRYPVPILICAHGLASGCTYPAQFNAFVAVDRQLNADQNMSLWPTYESAFVAPLVPVQVRERTTTTNRAKSFNALHERHRRPIEGRIRSLFATFRILAEPRAAYGSMDMTQYNRLLDALAMVWVHAVFDPPAGVTRYLKEGYEDGPRVTGLTTRVLGKYSCEDREQCVSRFL